MKTDLFQSCSHCWVFQICWNIEWRSEVKSLSRVWLFASPWTLAYQNPCPWNFPGKSTGVGCHSLLQGIFPTQESNPGLPHCRQILHCLSHQGSSPFSVTCSFFVLVSEWFPQFDLTAFPLSFSSLLYFYFSEIYVLGSEYSTLWTSFSPIFIDIVVDIYHCVSFNVMIWYMYIVKRLPQQG